ncbi:MAG: hypothetical protein M1825_005601 [Sarcosagium campestre]|nr:MAG: hypothetical protein M1825_005601 [Sarcosagium campestre]
MSTAQTALPYHEPSVAVILIEASFLIALNVINNVLDRGIYCGLVGQILLGTAWGTPGSKWLPIEAQESMVQIGYLGLILIVYEGGLATSVAGIRSNLILSIATAFTGICLPMALSFVLIALNDATPLQAFAAGAALCSTSLGTTFTVLESSGLTNSRLGTVLASAAMMDDVVGLIMVQIIASLGQAEESFGAVTVIRPAHADLSYNL